MLQTTVEFAFLNVFFFFSGAVLPPTASKKNSVKKNRLKLHPANAMVVQTLVPLSNCCSFEEDHAASARSVAIAS